jgi:hypothetical protein
MKVGDDRTALGSVKLPVKVKRLGEFKGPIDLFVYGLPPTLPGGFSPARYLKLNPDVAAAGVDPAKHYLEHGFQEGRRYS